ncbi:MAG: hypothetical protein GWN53_02910, partial [Gammaproteobacteria bacterium]|nr:hypothetical protein [Gemmatimonadota bacterium]NIT65071.1 hypothetical protein [Gemmatimonadota bacterium]NIV50827.1 hypothetical protein [Gammaproteobacteria bacterium]NIY33650.1 hypothetical protein [Gemmatimonadota bacterium]
MRRIHQIAMIGAILALAASSTPEAALAQDGTQALTNVIASAPLEPGDAVRLRFWREPELNGDAAVD